MWPCILNPGVDDVVCYEVRLFLRLMAKSLCIYIFEDIHLQVGRHLYFSLYIFDFDVV